MSHVLPIDRRRLFIGALALVACEPAHALAAPQRALIAAAEAQVGVTTLYDPAYERIAFPGGDVPEVRGVCTDVIVRAYRRAFGFDLQAAMNADMKQAFSAYPTRWGLSAPDTNIDHRRVPNLQTFFTRRGASRPVPTDMKDWQPGDIVSQLLWTSRPHIGIVSDKRSADGTRPLLIHNIGRGTQVEDMLAMFKITGRYVFFPG